MPRRKTKKIKEDYVPLREDSVKHSLEIPVKRLPREKIEKIEKIGTKKSVKLKRELKTSEEPYVLIITEKPQAALKIADALTDGNLKKNILNKVPYYELKRNGKKIIVACAVGHLFTLNQEEKAKKGNWPVFNIKWVPSYRKKGSDFIRKYYSLLKSVSKNASEIIVATDYDIEGEVIGWNIVRFICNQKDAKRMKFSSLTKSEIEDSYKNASPTLDWGQAIAGETRHHLDWLYGINLSRALMDAIKRAGSFRIMSIGRVQGPALNLIVKKEKQIQSFKPEPYWRVFIIIDWKVNGKKEKIELRYIKDLTKKSELKKFELIRGKTGEAKTHSKKQNILPPHPFDLTTFQTEAYKFYNISPSQTLQIAQKLYLDGLISYPRTSSQKIPPAINAKKILKKLEKKFKKEVGLAVRKKPVEGSKSDSAHPSIHPTGEFNGLNKLDENARKIYDLVARRFISCFCEDAEILNKKIEVVLNSLKFVIKGIQVKKSGWMDIYKARLKEKELPDVNGRVNIKEIRIEEKQTQPPKRYTPASLVSELTKRNLGTKATRANIIETLYNRGYIKEKSIQATPIGISLIETLERHSPIIIDESLTRQFEKEMGNIQKAKKNLEEKEAKVLDKAKKVILSIEKNFRKEEGEIGRELLGAMSSLREQERKENTFDKICPVCNKGNLHILYSRKFKRSFVACNKYPECRTTFTLPAGGIKKTEKTCESCGWPVLVLYKKLKRPWHFCFNPACPGRNKEDTIN